MPNVSFSTINVFNGEELGDTPQVSLAAAGAKRAGRTGETLLVFMDLPGASPSTCADIARTLNDGYTRAPGGLTSALRLAIKLANDRILQLNKGAPPQQRLDGSLSCALITPDSVIVAQAGPAVAYARSPGGAFEVIAPPVGGATQVVGVNPAIDVHFNNFAPQAGDVFVLSGAQSMTSVSDRLVDVCMSKGDARTVAGYLNANVKHGRMVGVAISVDEGLAKPAPVAEPARTQVAQVSGASEAVPSRASAVRDEVAAAASQVGASVASGMNQAARSVQRSMGLFGSRLLPQETANEAQERSRITTFLLAAIAVLLPIIIGIAVAVGYFQFSGEALRLQTRSNAQAQVDIATKSTDPAQARTNWAKALQLIGEYEAKTPGDKTTFADARARARQQLDSISNVTRIQPLALAQFDTAAPRRIAASALGVYALNPATRTAEYYVLNAERTGTTGKKVEISFGDSTTNTTALLADVAWATTTSERWRTEGAAFFTPGAVYEYASATGRAAPMTLIANADAAPQTVQAGELYNNSVYLLDTGVGQVWKYTLVGGELGGGGSYFRSAFNPLKESIDLAIDGAVYVLQKNGTVLKYFGRQPQPYAITGLPDPFVKVAALAVSGPDQFRGSVFVLDGVAGSVVELDKTGKFVRQYRGANDEFADAQDMSYDPTSNTIYVATKDKLFSFLVQVAAVAPVATPAGAEQAPELQPLPETNPQP